MVVLLLLPQVFRVNQELFHVVLYHHPCVTFCMTGISVVGCINLVVVVVVY